YEEIVAAYGAGDIKLAHRLAHSLKSSAGQIGREALQTVAAEVEGHLKREAELPPEPRMNAFKAELCVALEELRPYLEEAEAGAPYSDGAADDAEFGAPDSGLDREAARRLFERLGPMLRRGSPECLKLIPQLRQMLGCSALIRQLEDLSFDTALDLLDNMVKKV
ncbi:MAG: Hpt domain-containing protein, partial [Oscillospiraceae bacterium]|nr:Hpt domain-containing protein [Oscillospiraceae bacterium]